MYCSKCGNEVTGKFCSNCGDKIEQSPTQSKKANKAVILILDIIRCIIGFFVCVLCLGAFLSSSFLTGFLLFITIILIIPFSSHFVKAKLNIKIPKLIQAILIIVLFFIATLNFGTNGIDNTTESLNKKTETKSIKNSTLISEQKKIEKAKKYYNNNNLENAYLECKKIIPALTEIEAIDEANNLLSEINSAIPTIKASTLAKEYKDNEVKADIQYKDKFIRVTGVVDSIGKFIDDTYLYLKDGTSYSISKPHFYFSDESEILKVSELKEGDSVSILGKCSGATLSSATFYDCIIE